MTRFGSLILIPALGLSLGAFRSFGGADAVSFQHEIFPILENRCFDCHSSKKQKGELRLDSPSWIRKGSENGDVLIPGDPEASLMYYLTTYPADDPDYMPSKGEGLNTAEKELLKRWVEQGADFGEEATGAMAPSEDLFDFVHPTGKDTEEVPLPPASYEVSAQAAKTVRQLASLAVAVDTVNHDAEYLEVTYTYADSMAAYDLSLLGEVSNSVVKLNFGRSAVRDSDLDGLGRFPNLRYLDLRYTRVGDAALRQLQSAKWLEYLNLYQTEVSDEGLAALRGHQNLKKLYLYGTKATEAGVSDLKKAIPGLRVVW